jgi:hypothetical protein
VEDGKAIARETGLPNRQSGRVSAGRCFHARSILFGFQVAERFGRDMTEGRSHKKSANLILTVLKMEKAEPRPRRVYSPEG